MIIFAYLWKYLIFIVMRRILTFVFAAVAAMALAIDSSAQISVGVGYGMASHNAKYRYDKTWEKADPTNMSGFWIAGTYDFNFMSASWGDLAVQPGLTYSFYGKVLDKEKDKENDGISTAKSSRRDHYLDIPVNVKYSYDLLPGTLKLHAYAGPVFSFGLAAYAISDVNISSDGYKFSQYSKLNLYNGNVTSRTDNNGEKSNGKEKGDGTDYSMFDLKLGLGIGATVLDMFDVKIGYDIGLLNRYTGEVKKDQKTHTNVFYLGVAYNF